MVYIDLERAHIMHAEAKKTFETIMQLEHTPQPVVNAIANAHLLASQLIVQLLTDPRMQAGAQLPDEPSAN